MNSEKLIPNDRKLFTFNNVFDSFDEEDIDDDIEFGNEKIATFLIELESTFKYLWDVFMVILILLSCILSPLNICFEIKQLDFIEIIMEFSFILDIFLSFFTQNQNFNEELINSKNIIAKLYIKEWLIFDVISSFPFFAIEKFCDVENIYYYQDFKWIMFIRIIKLSKYSFVKNFKMLSNHRTLELGMYFFIFINVSSCYWIYLGHNEQTQVNWINNAILQDLSNWELYIASIYFHLVTVYSVGYGDVLSTNQKEYTYNIVLMIFGLVLYSFVLTSFSKFFSDEDPQKLKYMLKLENLDEINSNHNIGNDLYKSLKNFLQTGLKNSSDRFELIDNLTSKVKHELTGYIHNKLIKDLKFFKDQPYEFLLFVLPRLKYHKLDKHQVLFSTGELLDEMYIVLNGALSLNLGCLFGFLEISVIHQNNHFGEVLLQTNELSPFDLRSKSKVTELFVLKKVDFEKIKLNFMKNIIIILEESVKRLEIINKRKEQLMKLLNYENSIENVNMIIKKLDLYLFERGFEKYFFEDQPFQDINDFITNNDFSNIKNIINSFTKKKKRGKIIKDGHREGNIISKSIKDKIITNNCKILIPDHDIENKSSTEMVNMKNPSNLKKDKKKPFDKSSPIKKNLRKTSNFFSPDVKNKRDRLKKKKREFLIKFNVVFSKFRLNLLKL